MTDISTRGPFICLYVCHTRSQAVGWNEVPFGGDTYVAPSNVVIHRVAVPVGKGDLGVKALIAVIRVGFLPWQKVFCQDSGKTGDNW